MISDAINTAFRKKKERGWEKYPKIFIAIDLHDVVIPGTYTRNNEGRKFFPDGKEVLQWLTGRKDMCLILFTSSYEDAICDIIDWLAENEIKFDYVNCNPECCNTELCDFTNKFYMDILLEDKAGFVGETDWKMVKQTLIDIGEWEKKVSHDQNDQDDQDDQDDSLISPNAWKHCLAWSQIPGCNYACFEMCSKLQRETCKINGMAELRSQVK